ncbi:MAG: hypothetical protein AAB937_00515 [Patescibacteria group bacterium]
MKVTTVSIKSERLVEDGKGALRRFKRRTGRHLSVFGAGTGLMGHAETALNPTAHGDGTKVSDRDDVQYIEDKWARPMRTTPGRSFSVFGGGEIQVEDAQPKPRQRVIKLKIAI